jgi:hypothetical protein
MSTGESVKWTARRRFAETMRYGRPDRVPYFEEGLRDDVLAQWREQGLDDEASLRARFQTDRREQVPVDLEPRPPVKSWPRSRRGLKALRGRLDPDDPGRLPEDWPQRVEAWRTREHVLQLPVHRGLFLSMGVHDWPRFLEVIYLLHDEPSLVREIMEMYGEFGARLAERVLRDVEVDFATFSEPIGGNDRPLLSPEAYERLVLPGYVPILDALRRGGVRTVLFITYANARALLPGILAAGFDGLWACEAETDAMDYRALRRRFGPALRLIGGIDLDALLAGKAAIRREVETKVPPLLAQGGYVPLADGRVRANVPLENYVYYRRLLERVTRRFGGQSAPPEE